VLAETEELAVFPDFQAGFKDGTLDKGSGDERFGKGEGRRKGREVVW